MVATNALMADLFPDAQTSFKTNLQSAVQRLATNNIFIGTSSWKPKAHAHRTPVSFQEQRHVGLHSVEVPSIFLA
jgi:hypothetical protein